MKAAKEHKPQQSRVIQNNKRIPRVKQLYRIGNGNNRNVTVRGLNNVCIFRECLYNFVEYNRNDYRRIGTGTQTPALWAGCVMNAFNNRNATQLHIVNRRWGGLGGRYSGNIIPGTPALNHNHNIEVERWFDLLCFNNTNIATDNWSYECYATPAYGNNINMGHMPIGFCNDPTLHCIIRHNGYPIFNHVVTPGGGLRFINPG